MAPPPSSSANGAHHQRAKIGRKRRPEHKQARAGRFQAHLRAGPKANMY